MRAIQHDFFKRNVRELAPKKRIDVAARKTASIACECCHEPFYSENWKRLDHDYTTGVFRGVICRSCNSRIGIIEAPLKDIEGYQVQILYLKRAKGDL